MLFCLLQEKTFRNTFKSINLVNTKQQNLRLENELANRVEEMADVSTGDVGGNKRPSLLL